MRTRKIQDYGTAVVTVMAMIALHALLMPWVGPSHNTAFMICAVAVTLATGGPGPAILTAVLAFVCAVTLFGDPGSLSGMGRTGSDVTALMYAILCAVMIALGSWHARRSRGEREAHARDVQMLELVTDCFFVLDREWRFTHMNGPGLKYFDKQPQDLLGRSIWEVFPSGVGTSVDTLFRGVAASGVAARTELVGPLTNRWLDVRAVPTGTSLMVVFTDISQRRVAQDAAQHNADFLRVVADSVSVLIAYLDGQRRYRFVNRGYADAFGFDADAALGKTHTELCGAAAYEAIRQPLDDGFAGEAVSDEMPLRLANLGERHLLASYRPDRDESGQVRGVVLALSDITERVEAEIALREADRRKDEFLATLAHELRNPLAPIMNSVQLLGADTATRTNARAIIDRQVRHMARLVDDLLDVSRITLGRINLRRERVSVAQVVSHAVEASRPLIESSGHDFKVQLPAEALMVDADLMRLAQAVLNLLNNAAKYTPAGGRIELNVARAGDAVVIAVTDTGVGIPEAMLPRIFEMFAQVDRDLARAQGGLGIGLTLAAKLVSMHGGMLEAHSAGLGRGSRFEIRIPLASGASTGTAQLVPPATVLPQARRVLVVDDNVDAAESLSLLLQADGHHTELAHDGLEAVAASARFAPDIVLLDIGLPGLNGYEAAMRMRQDNGNGTRPRPTLVALTGWGQQQDRERAAQAGFDLHLTKPVDPAVIMALARDPRTPTLQQYSLARIRTLG
ncbi:MAG TPA: PAS domain-containing protein [Steroidobacteraceae bacterium]|jgi:two-component system CheB/CheR fusion protein|nr:PAS domain-containing protein [Steroidobacteraceae bacterium]